MPSPETFLAAALPSIGPMELVIVLLIVLILFGSSRLAQIGKGLGEGIRNFKRGVREDEKPEQLNEAEQGRKSET